MDLKKQKLLIEYLFSSKEAFSICYPILKAKYFHEDLQDSVNCIIKYFNEYNALPDPDILKAETGKIFQKENITSDKIEYCVNEIEKFCKDKALELAIRATPPLYEQKKYDEIHELIKDAVLVSLHRDMGIDFFTEPGERIQKLLEDDPVEPIGWEEFDSLNDGGIARKQMILFSANSGGGKSLVMLNVGINFTLKGYTVLLISLELSAEMIDKRTIQMITNNDSISWKKDPEKTEQKILNIANKLNVVKDGESRQGSLHIKRMKNGSTSNNIRSYLKEFELTYGRIPDMIIVDYVDLMGSNENISREHIFEKDKSATEELREIGEDYNAWIVTASQQNREAITATNLHQGHIAGGISKINTTDVYVSIIMNDAMREDGVMGFQFLKTRSSGGVGKTVYVSFNNKSLRITDKQSLDLTLINSGTSNKSSDEKEEILLHEDENDVLNVRNQFKNMLTPEL